MKSNSTLKAVITVLAVALGLVSCSRSETTNGSRDGNPIGFDIAGKPTAAAPRLLGSGMCLTNHNCTTVEWHYLANNPFPTCPKTVPSGAACTPNTIRALPQCPAGAQCITFSSKANAREINVESQYDLGEYHGPEPTDAAGIVIFR